MAHNIKPGVATGDEVQAIFNYAKEKGFALPAVNVIGSSTINGVLETAAKLNAPVIIQFSNGGAQFNAGKGLSNAGEIFLNPIQDYLDASLTFQHKPRLEIAHYGAKAGTIGCAILAFDRLKANT